jgi:hypothetical protein
MFKLIYCNINIAYLKLKICRKHLLNKLPQLTNQLKSDISLIIPSALLVMFFLCILITKFEDTKCDQEDQLDS